MYISTNTELAVLSARNVETTNLNLFLRLFGSLVNSSSCTETVLILAARGAFVLHLARQTVDVTADRAFKLIQLILVDTPASAVRRTAMEALRLTRLRLLDAQQ